MTIEIDIDSATSLTEIAAAVSNIAGDVDTAIGAAETSLSLLTSMATSNCDILGTIGALVGAATRQFKSAVYVSSRMFQSSIGELMKSAGAAIKSLKEKVVGVVSIIQNLFSRLTSATEEVLLRIKAAIKSVIGAINGVIDGIINSVLDIEGAIGSLIADLGKGIKDFFASGCSVVASSVTDIGKGAGIDSVVGAVTGTAEAAVESAMGTVKQNLDTIQTGTVTGISSSIVSINDSLTAVDDSLAALRNFA